METPSLDAGAPKFARRVLPWILAALALAVYAITVCRWVTIPSLATVARVAGWDWQIWAAQPVYFLVTYPLRWLPTGQLPLGLNLLNVALATCVMWQLARSVAILPQDRTRDQRLRGVVGDMGLLASPLAWLPPILAVVVLGTQITFWENATSGTTEMIDLLLFAYVVRCLLEFRVSQLDLWLIRASLVYGVGITNNWAMIGFLPLFLAVVLALKGLAFFRFDFLTKMLAAALPGLLLYFLLPAIALGASQPQASFGDALLLNLRTQKLFLFHPGFRFPFFLISLTSVLPLLLIVIRWPSFSGDMHPVGSYLTNFVMRIIHVAFFAGAVWWMYRPPYKEYLEFLPMKFLSLLYLSGLCIGYLAGYVIVIFGHPMPAMFLRTTTLDKLVNKATFLSVFAALIVMPVLLVRQNLPRIQAHNAPLLDDYARLMVNDLPKEKAVVLADEQARIYLLQAYYARHGLPNGNLLAHSQSLAFHGCQNYLAHRYNNRWPALPLRKDGRPLPEPIGGTPLSDQLTKLSRDYSIWYLHPSFGYYFEKFYQVPHGLVYQLVPYQAETIMIPPLPVEQIARNLTFWKNNEGLVKMAEELKSKDVGAAALCQMLSRALTFWGVELQHNGRLPEAAASFQRAYQLNDDNVVAYVNLAFNRQLQSGKMGPIQLDKNVDTKFGRYRSWDLVLGANGPFDDPAFAYYLANVYTRNGLNRQAKQQYLRIKQYDPNRLDVDLMLAQVYLQERAPDRVLQLVARVKNAGQPLDLPVQLELLRLEASAQLSRTNISAGVAVLDQALQRAPANLPLLSLATQVYLTYEQNEQALKVVEQRLKLTPKDADAVLAKALALMQKRDYANAITTLDYLLSLRPDLYVALFNRALAYMGLEKYKEAEADYQRIYRVFPESYEVLYGLAEVAYRMKDNLNTVKYCRLYMKYAPPGTMEHDEIYLRLKNLSPKTDTAFR